MKRLMGVAFAAVLITALTAINAGASPRDASHSSGTKAAVVKMKASKKKGPYFTGPATVEAGQELKIVNKTAPDQVGPHTFTLIKKGDIPTSRKEMKACENLDPKSVCSDIATAHEFDPQTFHINKPDVDVGKTGWDKSFGNTGDSWYTETEGEKTSREVSAKPGTTLHYFCVVHPFMVGKVKVVP